MVRKLVQMMEAGPVLTMGMKTTSVSPLVPQSSGKQTMRMPGEFDGEAQAMWEPEEDSNQPGVSGAPRGEAVCSGV